MLATDFVRLGLTFLVIITLLSIFMERASGRVYKALSWTILTLLAGAFVSAVGLIWTV